MLALCGVGRAQVCAQAGVLQPNASVSAGLGASSCTLADGSSYDAYQIVFPTRGAWSASVTAVDGVTPLSLILRNPSGAQVTSGASVQFPVEGARITSW
jgi:hypothetical protein